jgi:hypothetical protein
MKHHGVNRYGRVEVKLHEFLTSAIGEDEWSASSIGRFTPGKGARGAYWIVRLAGTQMPIWTLLRREISLVPAGNRCPIPR